MKHNPANVLYMGPDLRLALDMNRKSHPGLVMLAIEEVMTKPLAAAIAAIPESISESSIKDPSASGAPYSKKTLAMVAAIAVRVAIEAANGEVDRRPLIGEQRWTIAVRGYRSKMLLATIN